MTHIGAVPEGTAAEEAERLLGPLIVRARKQWFAMSGCDERHEDDGEPCSECGGTYEQVVAQRNYEKEEDLSRADGLPD